MNAIGLRVLAVAAALAVAGCTSSPQKPDTPAAPADPPSDLVTVPASPGTTPDAPPTGQSAVLAQAGTGPKDFSLSDLAAGNHNVTIRLRCHGDSGATVSSDARSLILSVPACADDVLYTAAFSSPPQDHVIHLAVAAGTSWDFGVWSD